MNNKRGNNRHIENLINSCAKIAIFLILEECEEILHKTKTKIRFQCFKTHFKHYYFLANPIPRVSPIEIGVFFSYIIKKFSQHLSHIQNWV